MKNAFEREAAKVSDQKKNDGLDLLDDMAGLAASAVVYKLSKDALEGRENVIQKANRKLSEHLRDIDYEETRAIPANPPKELTRRVIGAWLKGMFWRLLFAVPMLAYVITEVVWVLPTGLPTMKKDASYYIVIIVATVLLLGFTVISVYLLVSGFAGFFKKLAEIRQSKNAAEDPEKSPAENTAPEASEQPRAEARAADGRNGPPSAETAAKLELLDEFVRQGKLSSDVRDEILREFLAADRAPR